MHNPNDNPYDPQGYDSPSLPYVPYGSGEPQGSELPRPDAYDDTIYEYSSPSYYTPPASDVPVVPGQMLPQQDEDAGKPGEEARGKKRRAFWLIPLIVVVCLLVVGAALYGVLTYVNRSTPMKTLDAFCTDLQNGQYQQAYDQFSSNLQTQFTEADFAQLLEQDKVDRCTHGTASDSGDSATTSLKLVHHSQGVNNDLVTLRKDSQNNWKIDNLQQAS
jgi:hypothetical protein